MTPIVALGPAIAITLGALSFVLFGEVLAKAAAGGGIVGWKRSELRVVPPPAEPTAGDGGGIPVPDVLAVENLTVSFPGGSVPVRAVSLEVAPGEIVGVVGESGSGKTLTAMAIADLLPAAAQMTTARYTLFGQDPRTLGDSQRRRLLGRSLAVVYQDPMSALNPALRVGRQLAEVSEVHDGLSKSPATQRAVDRLGSVRIANPAARDRHYPHAISGGMRQRAVIAMGLMSEPKLIIADEPTTALDVTVQQQILQLLERSAPPAARRRS